VQRPMAGRTKTTSGRVPRNTLSRPQIVEAALAVVDHEGLEALTMPRVADELGVGTMSLYRHVEGKDDLLDAVAARILHGVAVPSGPHDDWERRVVGYVRRLRQEAFAHPALARILADRGLTVAPVLEQLEMAHGILRAAGFSDVDAIRAFYSLVTYVLGSLMWELPRVHLQPPSAYAAAWHHVLDELDPEAYPNLVDLRQQLITAASDEQFEYGLDHLVASLRPHAKPKRKRR
jgi:TetR/AcrR family transcriptional regulator, tetracycline repressor protein